MIANLQLSTTEPKTKTKTKTKPITRTGTESQKWRSHGRLSVGQGREENGGKGAGNKKHKWQVENRGKLRIVQEIQKPKNLYLQPMDMD